VVVVEHDMQFIRMIARKVTVFHQGQILAEDAVERIMQDERVRDIYLGKEAGTTVREGRPP
jgi:branched-chain amino acid transport system ATP-binding protein/urea transport system ATP-binding protein